MKITVITLYVPDDATHLVAVVEGEVSHEDFTLMARGLRAVAHGTEEFHKAITEGEEAVSKQLFKVELDTYTTIKDVKSLKMLY